MTGTRTHATSCRTTPLSPDARTEHPSAAPLHTIMLQLRGTPLLAVLALACLAVVAQGAQDVCFQPHSSAACNNPVGTPQCAATDTCSFNGIDNATGLAESTMQECTATTLQLMLFRGSEVCNPSIAAEIQEVPLETCVCFPNSGAPGGMVCGINTCMGSGAAHPAFALATLLGLICLALLV